MKVVKIICRIIGTIVCIVVIAALVVIGTLTITEYKPGDKESLTFEGTAEKTLKVGDSLRVMSWNIGYCGLDQNADFFMDGGTHVSTASEEDVLNNVYAIKNGIENQQADVVFLQEVDTNSKRSHMIDQREMIGSQMDGYMNSYAYNYKVLYVPYPWPPIGKVECGIMTLSDLDMSKATRVSLPCPFKYPVRLANLKRCLMINRIPLEDSEKELVLVNLHLEAYDEGAGKDAQTQMLRDLLQDEVEEGNYVIAGGDFNQVFSNVDSSAYPTINSEMWVPGVVDEAGFDAQWQFLMDPSVPSCRSLDRAYAGSDPNNFQYYMIDGFIVSGNIQVDQMETLDFGFENADHNPIAMNITLSE